MTLQAVAGFLGQSGIQHPANLYRNLVSGLAGKRSGFFRYNDFTLTPSGGAMSLQIGAGDAVLMGTEAVTTQGGYYVWNNATETLAWPASTSLPRVDSLILRVIGTDYGADPAGSKATWEVVSGTPAASPNPVSDSQFAPAGSFYHPGAWLRVADFTVPASSTNLAAATLSHKRKYARLGRHTMTLNADFPADPQTGDQVTVIDSSNPGGLYIYAGGGWVSVGGRRTSYTPALQASTTNPTLGTGSTALGWYFYGPGNTVTVGFFIQFGSSGVNAGSGQYLITLPVAANAALGSGQPAMGAGMIRRSSGGDIRAATLYIPSSNLGVVSMVPDATGGTIGATAPWSAAWAASDYLAGEITYPI